MVKYLKHWLCFREHSELDCQPKRVDLMQFLAPKNLKNTELLKWNLNNANFLQSLCQFVVGFFNVCDAWRLFYICHFNGIYLFTEKVHCISFCCELAQEKGVSPIRPCFYSSCAFEGINWKLINDSGRLPCKVWKSYSTTIFNSGMVPYRCLSPLFLILALIDYNVYRFFM